MGDPQARDELVRRARESGGEALDELLAASSPAVRRFLRKRVGARLERFVSISDMEQEVLLQGEQILRRLPPDASLADFQALLFQHARWSVGKAVDRHRGSHGESSAAGGSVPGPSRSMGTVTRRDEMSWFRSRVEELPEKQRQVVIHRMDGRTFREIGEDLGIGEDAARKRFLTAALRLQGRDGDQG